MISLAIAGTTHRTAQIAQTLFDDPRFSINWILTPSPKPIGRKKIITPNPLDTFAQENQISTVYVNKRIDNNVKTQVNTLPKPEILLVVDFGYLVPKWLLELPTKAPINIHPSLLPRWRGSSPGQFVLLSGEKESGVSVIIMDEGLDTGPVIFQSKFALNKEWSQEEYYQHSFDNISKEIGNVLEMFVNNNIEPKNQPNESPTIVARQLSKQDSFISWEVLEKAMNEAIEESELPELLQTQGNNLDRSPVQKIVDACRAFYPWPGMWTKIATEKGEKRMKILKCEKNNDKLELIKVQIEGKIQSEWKHIESTI